MKSDSILTQQIWELILEDLEVKIITGFYKGFSQLPSIKSLSEQYNVSKSTIQKTLDFMCQNGTLTKRHGIGFFVKPYVSDSLRTAQIKSYEERLKIIAEKMSILELNDEEIRIILERVNDCLKKGAKL